MIYANVLVNFKLTTKLKEQGKKRAFMSKKKCLITGPDLAVRNLAVTNKTKTNKNKKQTSK